MPCIDPPLARYESLLALEAQNEVVAKVLT